MLGAIDDHQFLWTVSILVAVENLDRVAMELAGCVSCVILSCEPCQVDNCFGKELQYFLHSLLGTIDGSLDDYVSDI